MKCFDVTFMPRSIDGYSRTIRVPAPNIEVCRSYVKAFYSDLIININEVKENEELKHEEEKDARYCPFSFENGKMTTCRKDKCMAFKHIIDGSGEYVAEYCSLIDRKEK